MIAVISKYNIEKEIQLNIHYIIHYDKLSLLHIDNNGNITIYLYETNIITLEI